MAKSCRIRAVADADLPMLLSWRNHQEVRRFMVTQHEISAEEHRSWFAKASKDCTRRLLIVEDRFGPFGYVQLSHVSAGGVANWGFYSSPNAPKGSGRKLGQIALSHAFDELKLHKVCGQALESNTGSIAFHKRLGFTQEGVLRDQVCIVGIYNSLVCFGLLAHEWRLHPDFMESASGND